MAMLINVIGEKLFICVLEKMVYFKPQIIID